MSDLKNLILEKVFRKEENWKKVEFILSATHLTLNTIAKASTIARTNDFHNFGHQIGAAESVILIGRAAGITQSEIDMLTLIMLCHDGMFDIRMRQMNEIRAFESMEMIMRESDTSAIDIPYETIISKGRDLILATIPESRGKFATLHEQIVQDADLGHLGKGPIYWMWASMGLVDEFSHQEGALLSPVMFIRERQEQFVKFLSKVGGGHPYLTQAAQYIFRNPVDDVRTVISYSTQQINYAYRVRKDDITLEAFTAQFEALG